MDDYAFQRRRLERYYYLAMGPVFALATIWLTLRGHGLPAALSIALAFTVPMAVISQSTRHMCRALPAKRVGGGRLLVIIGSASLLVSGVMAGVFAAILRRIPLFDPALLRPTASFLFGLGLFYFHTSIAFHYLLAALERARKAEQEADLAKVAGREAKLQALRNQLDPHFLFNCLNSVAAMTQLDPAGARQMVLRLSEFLRATLKKGQAEWITLKEELDLAAIYLRIEQVRFSDRMVFVEQIEKDCLGVRVPPLILQPLLENAVKHGVARSADEVEVKLVVACLGQQVQVVVENSVAGGVATRGTGIGLPTVRERLAHCYGDNGRFSVTEADGRYKAVLGFPAQKME